MAITHSLEATDWTIDRQTGNIRYAGDDHNGTSPSYATVIQFHRWLGSLADDQSPAAVDDELDITATLPSQRSTDNIITLINDYNIDDTAAEHLYDGSIIQDGGDTIYDGIVNFGNSNVQVQILQDGAIIADDYWNYNIGAAASGGSGTTLVDTGIGWTTDEWEGYTVLNTTEGCQGLASSNTTDTITFESGQLHKGTNQDFAASDNYLIGQPLNPNSAQGISHRFMVKTRADGVDIDGRRLIGICRRLGNTYAEFKINGTSRGNNVLALSDSADLNNSGTGGTAPATILGTTWDTDFSNTGGLSLIDVDQDGSDEEYFSEWTWINTHTINDLYERVKGLTEDVATETSELGHGIAGNILRGITHNFAWDADAGVQPTDNDMVAYGTNIAYTGGTGTYYVGGAIVEDTATPTWYGRILAVDDNTGTGNLVVDITGGSAGVATNAETFTSYETDGTSAGTGTVGGTPTVVSGGGVFHCLAVDDDAGAGNLYVQVLKGTISSNNVVLYNCGTDLSAITIGNTLTQAGTATERSISTPYIGVSTGSAIIGSYGFGVAYTKLSATDLVFDLTNTAVTPPNNVTNTITGVVATEDYVLVAPWDGSSTDTNGDPAIDFDQMETNAAYTTGAVGTISVVDIPDSTPNSGTIRLVNDEGFHIRLPYDSYSDSTNDFTLTATYDFSGSGLNDSAASGNDCYVTYIDKLATGTSENFSAVYDSDLDLVIVIRDGKATPIKQFISSWSFGNSNTSTGAIRTSDA